MSIFSKNKDKDKDKELISATKKGDVEAVRNLLAENVNINIRSYFGWTALMLSIKQGYKDIAKLLIEKGADIDEKNDSKETALILATYKGYKDIVQALLDKGADVKAKNKYDNTALSLAEYKGYTAIERLIKAKMPKKASSTSDKDLLQELEVKETKIVNLKEEVKRLKAELRELKKYEGAYIGNFKVHLDKETAKNKKKTMASEKMEEEIAEAKERAKEKGQELTEKEIGLIKGKWHQFISRIKY